MISAFRCADEGVLPWLQGHGAEFLSAESPEEEAVLQRVVNALRSYRAPEASQQGFMDASNLVNYMRLSAAGKNVRCMGPRTWKLVGDAGCTPGMELS